MLIFACCFEISYFLLENVITVIIVLYLGLHGLIIVSSISITDINK